MGSSCENSAFAKTANPWDLERVPGGSSGGSAAAVAARIVPVSLGSDTGGSIRQPASFCGTVGLKPTYGRVSRYGLVAFASSLDQIGPFANHVADAAILLDAIGGCDPKDSTSLPEPCSGFRDRILAVEPEHVRGLRIGLPKEYFAGDGLAPSVRNAMEKSIALYRSLGAECVEVSLPRTSYAVAAYYIIATAEASANLARFDGIRYGLRADDALDLIATYLRSRGQGFGPEVKRRILLGTYVLSSGYYDAYYLRAQKVRTLIRNDFEEAFRHCDVLLAPVVPTPAFRFGEKADPLEMYLSDIFTISVNLAGICAVSLPADMDPERKLPIGVQIIGPALGESSILTAARALELARPIRDFAPHVPGVP
jgi:aspartyl-tRNA(Asn)/glutamyl-tRNA(Gln) amidotransferase subunit A